MSTADEDEVEDVHEKAGGGNRVTRASPSSLRVINIADSDDSDETVDQHCHFDIEITKVMYLVMLGGGQVGADGYTGHVGVQFLS